MLRILFIVLMLATGAATAARATEVVYSDQGKPVFVFEMPKGWSLTRGPDVLASQMPGGVLPAPRVYSVRPPDEAGVMWTGLWLARNARNAKEFASAVRRLRPKLLEGVKVTYRDERVVDGLPVSIVAGHGRRDGRPFDIVFAGVQLTPERLAVVAFIGEPEVFDRYEVVLSDMLATVRPVGGEARK